MTRAQEPKHPISSLRDSYSKGVSTRDRPGTDPVQGPPGPPAPKNPKTPFLGPLGPQKAPGSPLGVPRQPQSVAQAVTRAVKKNNNWENMKKGSKKEGSKTMLETTGAKF